MPANPDIANTIISLPLKPGVYLFRNARDEVIYVGKAKQLKKRVSSYFSKTNTGKTKVLVAKIASIQTIVVQTEHDALLLENSLIKKYQPRYNVLLKDDKSYPWICIKREAFPRVFSTRNKINDGSEYFGPYTSMVLVRTILDLIRQLYPLRTCKYNLSTENIRAGKFKTCLEYHIGKCKAPCIGKQAENEYNEIIDQTRSILKGNINELKDHLKALMKEYSFEYKYEEAAYLKEKIEIIDNFRSKSTVVSPNITNIDVFSIIDRDNTVYINYLRLTEGAIVYSRSIELKRKLDESREDLLILAITEVINDIGEVSRETILPFEVDYDFPGMKIIVPKRGEKRNLLELSERNAKYFMLERKKSAELSVERTKRTKVLERLMEDLRLKHVPHHLECFDNSNIQGTDPVASCVVFRDGKPRRSEYRHFNIKTVKGANDFASMKEVVLRRYRRLLEENKELPQAVIVDGGKGQLNAATEALDELGLRGKLPVFGIAKRLEEIFIPGDPVPLYLDKNSSSLKIVQHLRNEAHRFGIEFHRQKRSSGFTGSELDSIKGIGEKTAEKLLQKFKSVERIKKVDIKTLQEEIGQAKTRILLDYFKNTAGSK